MISGCFAITKLKDQNSRFVSLRMSETLDKFTKLLDIEMFPCIRESASPRTAELTVSLFNAWLASRMGEGVLLQLESLEDGLERSAAST